MPDASAALPFGDVAFYDNLLPATRAGRYWVTVTHELPDGVRSGDPFSAVQEFLVEAPQFALEASDILSVHPPRGATGLFAEQLPHLVFREPSLPWERRVGGDARTPWLALLVLTEDELDGGGTEERGGTGVVTARIRDFLAPEPGVLKPAVVPGGEVDPDTACRYIRLPADRFAALMPRREELRFLAHCRRSGVGDKAAQNLNAEGLVSVVTANRFPAQPPDGAAPVKNIVHLVSVEGLEDWLVERPDFAGRTSVALLSLASWSFQCVRDHAVDFQGLVEGLRGGADQEPDALWLRLSPPPATAANGVAADPAALEVSDRLAHGFVPLAWHTRTGETAFAWYRGPLTPVQPAPVIKPGPLLTADAAIVYQQRFGMFDLSLAAAWEAGRTAALSDKDFARRLLAFRRWAMSHVDELRERLDTVGPSARSQGAALADGRSAQERLLSVLDAELVDRIGGLGARLLSGTETAPRPAGRDAPAADPQAAVRDLLENPAVQQMIEAIVSEDAQGLASWLARLTLFYPLPFNLLVADERMLPAESLRFFRVDANWVDALVDGALSLGLESSRQTLFNALTRGVLGRLARKAAQDLRRQATGVEPAGSDAGPDGDGQTISGLLLRSALVSGWPTLSVQPYAGDQPVKILRMDHLSPTVLLVLFAGIPDRIEIAEPQEGFRFGVDGSGTATSRRLEGAVGEQVGDQVPVYDAHGREARQMRDRTGRVLNLAPGGAGLVRTLGEALAKAGAPPGGPLEPAQFALQMIKSPEAIVFHCQIP
ncbi:hypothetical protein J2847_003349 [Azospirillum agricola]|uniref:hypothetical protein n=1 Tax=Azospirillum agricola TaxID=1720247 RepID=UPI001AE74DA8|nr:hypothetical protein [Azospirillum agricola]MBP2230046.1 hypothetical protein [Azospirillum agricola]